MCFRRRTRLIFQKIFPTSFLRVIFFAFFSIATYKKSFSAKGEDIIVNLYFKDAGISKGTYLDIGCYHPIFGSNTHLLHKTGWSGYGVDIDKFAEYLEEEYEDYRGDKNFVLSTSTAILEQINSVLGILQYVVVGIAGIALIVGSVGIANTMYMSVLERTKEIGIMKSIGATNNAILTMFLIESAFFGIVGGIIGCIIGILMAVIAKFAIEAFAPGIPFLILIDPGVIIGALIFSAISGIVSGILPARNASKLNPVDALRYE